MRGMKARELFVWILVGFRKTSGVSSEFVKDMGYTAERPLCR